MKESVPAIDTFIMDDCFARNLLHACSSKLFPVNEDCFSILKSGLENFAYFRPRSDLEDIHDPRDLCVLLVDSWALSQIPESVVFNTSTWHMDKSRKKKLV